MQEKKVMNDDLLICRVLVRYLPMTMNAGKAMAQVHHAGTKMMYESEKPETINKWMSQTLCGFGTVLTLQNQNKELNQVIELENAVQIASALEYPSGIVTDPTYPFDFQQTASVVTCAYILCTNAEWEDKIRPMMNEGWKLCP